MSRSCCRTFTYSKPTDKEFNNSKTKAVARFNDRRQNLLFNI